MAHETTLAPARSIDRRLGSRIAACPHCDQRVGVGASTVWIHIKFECTVLTARRDRGAA